MGDLHPQLRKQWKLKISRVWSHSVFSPSCSKIRPVLQTWLQLLQEAEAARASPANLLLLIMGRCSQADGSPMCQQKHGDSPYADAFTICNDWMEQGSSNPNVVMISPHGGFFSYKLSICLANLKWPAEMYHRQWCSCRKDLLRPTVVCLGGEVPPGEIINYSRSHRKAENKAHFLAWPDSQFDFRQSFG